MNPANTPTATPFTTLVATPDTAPPPKPSSPASGRALGTLRDGRHTAAGEQRPVRSSPIAFTLLLRLTRGTPRVDAAAL